jgi:hypothetical protein
MWVCGLLYEDGSGMCFKLSPRIPKKKSDHHGGDRQKDKQVNYPLIHAELLAYNRDILT